MTARLPPRTVITCERGHRICVTNHEMIASPERPPVKPEWFMDFGPEHYQPVAGDLAGVCRCGICGAPWIDERPGIRSDGTRADHVAKLHTEHGWWP